MAKKKSFSINQSLSKGLADTIHAAQDFSGDLHVEAIALDRLQTDPNNPRQLSLSMEDIQAFLSGQVVLNHQQQQELDALVSLGQSIQENGLINPITVYREQDHYRLLAGERRTLSSLLVGKRYILARILPQKPTTLQRFIMQWAENMERSDLSLWERIENVRQVVLAYAEQEGKKLSAITAAEISQLIATASSQSAQYKLVLMAGPQLLNAIKNQEVTNLDKAALISKAPRDHQVTLITLCAQGATLKQLKQAIVELQAPVDLALGVVTDNSRTKVVIEDERVMQTFLRCLNDAPEYRSLLTTLGYDATLQGKALSTLLQKVINRISNK